MAFLRQLQALTFLPFINSRSRVASGTEVWLEELEPRVVPSIYYISPSGNDSYDGTEQTHTTGNTGPWQTITRVNQQATAGLHGGDQVLFQGGQTFGGNLVFGTNDGGATGNPVTVGSYGSGRATINAGGGSGLVLNNVWSFTISSLVIVGSGVGTSPLSSCGIYTYGWGFGGGSSGFPTGLTIDSVDVSGFGGLGISLGKSTNVSLPAPGLTPTGGYNQVSVTRSNLHDNGVGGLDTQSVTDLYVGHVQAYHNSGVVGLGESGLGINLSSASHAVVERCEAHDNGWLSGNGGAFSGVEAIVSDHILFQYNESYNNHKGPSDGDGIAFDICTDSVMQFNYSHGNDGSGLWTGAETGYNENYVTVRYNVSENDGLQGQGYAGISVWQNVTNADIYNNTAFVNNAASSPFIFNSFSGSSVNARNNLFVTSGGIKLAYTLGSVTNGSLQGNDYWPSGSSFLINWAGNSYSSLSAFQAGTGQEMLNSSPVGEQVDPKLNNPGGGGTIGNADQLNTLSAYQLAYSSPVASAALTLSQFGTSWDPYSFAGDSFLSKYFNANATDFYGNVLPTTTPSVGAYQVGVLPPGWADRDIGSPAYGGSATYRNTTPYAEWHLPGDRRRRRHLGDQRPIQFHQSGVRWRRDRRGQGQLDERIFRQPQWVRQDRGHVP
jgi:hypothetical protein